MFQVLHDNYLDENIIDVPVTLPSYYKYYSEIPSNLSNLQHTSTEVGNFSELLEELKTKKAMKDDFDIKTVLEEEIIGGYEEDFEEGTNHIGSISSLFDEIAKNRKR